MADGLTGTRRPLHVQSIVSELVDVYGTAEGAAAVAGVVIPMATHGQSARVHLVQHGAEWSAWWQR